MKSIYDHSCWSFNPFNSKIEQPTTNNEEKVNVETEEDSLSRLDRCREELDKAISLNEKQRESMENT